MTRQGTLFRVEELFGGKPGDFFIGTDPAIGLYAALHVFSNNGYILGEVNPTSDELDIGSINAYLNHI